MLLNTLRCIVLYWFKKKTLTSLRDFWLSRWSCWCTKADNFINSVSILDRFLTYMGWLNLVLLIGWALFHLQRNLQHQRDFSAQFAALRLLRRPREKVCAFQDWQRAERESFSFKCASQEATHNLGFRKQWVCAAQFVLVAHACFFKLAVCWDLWRLLNQLIFSYHSISPPLEAQFLISSSTNMRKIVRML